MIPQGILSLRFLLTSHFFRAKLVNIKEGEKIEIN